MRLLCHMIGWQGPPATAGGTDLPSTAAATQLSDRQPTRYPDGSERLTYCPRLLTPN